MHQNDYLPHEKLRSRRLPRAELAATQKVQLKYSSVESLQDCHIFWVVAIKRSLPPSSAFSQSAF